MSSNSFEKLLDLLDRLDKANIYYTLAHSQQDAITVKVDVPGQRWEIDYYSNGTIDVEVLKSDGSIRHEDAIEELLRKFSD
jgi:hypothetical protein